MALRDLIARFDIQVDGGQKLADTDVAIRRTILSAERLGNTFKRLGAFLIVGAVVNGIKNFIESQVEQANALKYNAERLGITTDELQKYQYASSLMGVSTKETTIAMRFFNRAIGEASLGTKAAVKTFNYLGINVKDANGQIRPTNELLFEFSDKLKKIPSQAIRTALAVRTLGRNGSQFLPALQKGGDELRKIFQDVDELGGGFNQDFINNAAKTNVELKRLKFAWTSLKVALASELLPIVRKWTADGIKTAKVLIYLAKHTYGFRTALMLLAGGATFLALKRLFSLFSVGKTTLWDLFKAAVTNPYVAAFVAIITTLYLAFDDFYTFLKGGDSLIGDFFNSLGGKGAAKEFRDTLVEAFEKVKAVFFPLKDSMKDFAISVLHAFKDALPYIIQWSAAFATGIVSLIDTAVTGMRQLLGLMMLAAHSFEKSRAGTLGKEFDDIKKLGDDWDKRIKAYTNLNDALQNGFDNLGKPKPRSGITPAGGLSGLPPPPLPGGGIDAHGGLLGIPPPPKPGLHFLINIDNHINGDVSPATVKAIGVVTKAAVKDGATKARDAWNATNAGMPATGQ